MKAAVETGRPVCAFGEIVALLWEAGDVPGAIELERLWCELQRELPFSLLCVYPSSMVSGPGHADALREICGLHSAATGVPARASGHVPLGERREPASEQFLPRLDAPRAARAFLADVLRRSGGSSRVVEDAQLVLSELATNAVVHARSPFSVTVNAEGSRVRIAVHDCGPGRPAMRTVAPDATSGRGLQVVAALSREWGVEPTADGKAVWAELTA